MGSSRVARGGRPRVEGMSGKGTSAKKKEEGSSKGTEEKKKLVQDIIDEDDEFEEFPRENWEKKDEDQQDEKLWEDKWDDDDVDAQFSVQLRKEIEKAINSFGKAQRK